MRKIAVTYKDGCVYHHCCQAPQLKIYTIKSDMLSSIEIVDVPQQGADEMAQLLKEHNIKVVICGVIGRYFKELLEKTLHMEVYNGVEGDADSAVVGYLAGTLDFEPNMHCDAPEHIYDCSGHGQEHSYD